MITPAGVVTNYYLSSELQPDSIAFDGTNMWIADYYANSISEISPTGVVLATYSTGSGTEPAAIAFDGTNMWTANLNSTVSKVLVNNK
jgi:DNA-binding beta-propeller fold protein YncE